MVLFTIRGLRWCYFVWILGGAAGALILVIFFFFCTLGLGTKSHNIAADVLIVFLIILLLSDSCRSEWRVCGMAYWRLVRRPWYEDPLVALCILGVEAVKDVAGLLVVQERKQEVIIILVPALFRLSVGPQHQLLWKSDHYSSHTLPPHMWHVLCRLNIK